MLQAHDNQVVCLHVAVDSMSVLSGSSTGEIKIHTIAHGSCEQHIPAGGVLKGPIKDLVSNPAVRIIVECVAAVENILTAVIFVEVGRSQLLLSHVHLLRFWIHSGV